MRAAVILGAGFSKNSGLPVQAEIPELLIEKQKDNDFENAISHIIKKFYEDTFGFSNGSALPSLDDVLTCIDISTNSGHHLGIKYSSIHLRAIRRFLVYRLFSVLQKNFVLSEDVEKFIRSLRDIYSRLDFIVLNWDTVLEKYIYLVEPEINIDYCNGGKQIRTNTVDSKKEEIKVIKIHGSSNWLFCDNCREIFIDSKDHIPLIKRAGFKAMDFELFDEFKGTHINLESEKCIICGDYISSHIATFSFRKSFRGNSFPQVWSKAEEVLTDSDKWIFVGYSMPQADYEFKHLLKIAELKLNHIRERKLEIDVVLLNSTTTISVYKSFFGNRIARICNGGIAEYIKWL